MLTSIKDNNKCKPLSRFCRKRELSGSSNFYILVKIIGKGKKKYDAAKFR
jgi:hypothetical protein